MTRTRRTIRKMTPLARSIARNHNYASRLAKYLDVLSVRVQDLEMELVATQKQADLIANLNLIPGWICLDIPDAQLLREALTYLTAACAATRTPSADHTMSQITDLDASLTHLLEVLHQCQSNPSASQETPLPSSERSS